MHDDFVADEIEIDPVVADEIFRKSLQKGWKAYLDKLERFVSFDDEIDTKAENISKAFHYMRIWIDSKGFQGLVVEDFSECGLDLKCLPRLRYLIFQMENSSPSRNSLLYSQVAGRDRRISSQTEEYEDDFEVEEDLPSSSTIGEDSGTMLGRPSYPAKEVAEEIGDDFYGGSVTVPLSAPRMQESNSPKISRHRRSPDADAQGKHSAASLEYMSKRDTKGYSNDAWEDDRIPRRAEPRQLAGGGAAGTGITSSSSTSTGSGIRSRRGKDERWVKEKRWRLGDNIGKGSFGEVFQGMNDKGQLFAVKRLNMVGRRDEVEDLTREISLMKELEHPNIVAYIGSYVDESQGLVYIFQEWVPGGSVAHLLQKYGAFELGAVRNYTRQILHGLVYLHENGIVHRDIKGANVLVTDTGRVPVVKLADFGASTKIVMDQTQDTATIKGTPYFMAPEVMATSKYGRKGDIWAVGCTMIQMLTGSPPWKEFNIQNLVQLHLLLTGWTKGPPPYNRDITVEAQECLNLCFGKEPDQRPTAAQLLRCAFLVGGDELDESAGSFVEDHHEESADLSRLKQQMSRASLAAPELRPRIATGTSTGTGTAGGGGGGGAAVPAEDTLADIERRMKEQAESNKKNPFAKKSNQELPSPHNSGRDTRSEAHSHGLGGSVQGPTQIAQRGSVARDSKSDNYFSSSGSGSVTLSVDADRGRTREAYRPRDMGENLGRSRAEIDRIDASEATCSYDFEETRRPARSPFEPIVNPDAKPSSSSALPSPSSGRSSRPVSGREYIGANPSPGGAYDVSRTTSAGGADRDKLQVLKRRSATGQSISSALRGSSSTPSDHSSRTSSRSRSRPQHGHEEEYEEAELDIIRGPPSGASSAQASRYAGAPSPTSQLRTPQPRTSAQRRGSGSSSALLPSADRHTGSRITAPSSSNRTPNVAPTPAIGNSSGKRSSNPRSGAVGSGGAGSASRVRTPGGFLADGAVGNSGVDDEADVPWKCHKCGVMCYDPEFCTQCATKKKAFGYTGQKS